MYSRQFNFPYENIEIHALEENNGRKEMVTTSLWNIVVAVVIVITAAPTYGFVVVVPVTCGTCITNTKTALYGRRMKSGTLGSISFSNDDDDSDGNISTTKKTNSAIKTRTRKKASSATKRNKKKDGNNKNINKKANLSTTTPSISPALAQWMETAEGQKEDTSADVMIVDSIDDDDKKVKKKVKRQRPQSKKLRRQSQRGNDVRQIKIDSTLDCLQEILEEKSGNVRDILNVVQELLLIDDQLSLSQPSKKSNDLRQLLMSKERTDYRLSWVGGDDAICHIGTGLHKVPLARMQEVFLNCIGSNRIEILEVISLLGPFPNVKNILQGTTRMINDKGSNADVQIVMDKMFDGTGSEILAGTDDNIRRVDLQIAFCDERVIVAVVPPEGQNKDNKINPLDDDGKRVLLFVKENKLDEKLDALRV
mmetsp:Transcript_29248/g.32842  ORF Transcript_29248/g.32842 Transcript_29248/m.32842 type:complete len:423 (+) Transcript_29248:17-1285(+)